MQIVHDDRHQPDQVAAPTVLPLGPSSVPLARRIARHSLRDAGIQDPEVLDTVELLVSELTSNVANHTNGQATLSVVRIGTIVRVEVCDLEPAADPVKQRIDVTAERGRGLLLVSSLATSWGVDRSPDHKCTWAELDVAASERG